MARVLIPLPSLDFDPTEVAVSWLVLSNEGHRVTFSTPDGKPAQCDPIMISGRGLDPWSPIPMIGDIKLIGLILRANGDARRAYASMTKTPAYQSPLVWRDTVSADFDGLLLGGGHCARGMRQYLESEILQQLGGEFFAADKPVAAICHGVLLAARSRGADGRSALYGRKTTALTRAMERTAYFLTAWSLGDYYRTYAAYLQDEVTAQLGPQGQFETGPWIDKILSRRDSMTDVSHGFIVQDGLYLSARWPGDAHRFGFEFVEMLRRQEVE